MVLMRSKMSQPAAIFLPYKPQHKAFIVMFQDIAAPIGNLSTCQGRKRKKEGIKSKNSKAKQTKKYVS